MAYRCSAVVTPVAFNDVDLSIERLRNGHDRVAVINGGSPKGLLKCHYLAGRPHELQGKRDWNSGDAEHFGKTESMDYGFADILSRATGCGYYPDAQVPYCALLELFELTRRLDVPVWVYCSEASGGSLDCEYSWLLSKEHLRLTVMDESQGNYIEFTSDDETRTNTDAFSAGIAFLGIQDVRAIRDVLFAG